MGRRLKVFREEEKGITIPATFTNGAASALKQHFETKNVKHIEGSLWKDRKAIYSIDGKKYTVLDIDN